MTLTMIDVEATEDLDFEPGCDWEDCGDGATHRMQPVDPRCCGCIGLLCTPHAEAEWDWINDVTGWQCKTCGHLIEDEVNGRELWVVERL